MFFFGDGNQLAMLLLHGFILPCASDKTGRLPASASCRPLPQFDQHIHLPSAFRS